MPFRAHHGRLSRTHIIGNKARTVGKGTSVEKTRRFVSAKRKVFHEVKSRKKKKSDTPGPCSSSLVLLLLLLRESFNYVFGRGLLFTTTITTKLFPNVSRVSVRRCRTTCAGEWGHSGSTRPCCTPERHLPADFRNVRN